MVTWARKVLPEEITTPYADKLKAQVVTGRGLLAMKNTQDFVLAGIPVGPAATLAEAVNELCGSIQPAAPALGMV